MKKIYLSTLALALIIGSPVATTASAEFLGTNLGGTVNSDSEVNTNWKSNLGIDFKHQRGENDGEDQAKSRAIYGTITAISGTTLTIATKDGDHVYTVNTTNVRLDKSGTPIVLSALVVGDKVAIEGTKTDTTITATAIHTGLFSKGFMGEQKRATVGTVTAVSGNTITISRMGFGSDHTATIYTVNAANAKIEKNGERALVSNIAVGDIIVVKGMTTGTTIVATKIQDGKMNDEGMMPNGNGQPIVGGTVTAITGTMITLSNKSNVAYTVDASHATFLKNGTASTATDVKVGDTVLAQGTINGTAVVASSVMDQGAANVHMNDGNDNDKNDNNGKQRGFFGRMGSFFAHLFGF